MASRAAEQASCVSTGSAGNGAVSVPRVLRFTPSASKLAETKARAILVVSS
jgi:hypothetical protein